MQRYSGKNITIKYGGALMGNKNLCSSFAKDTVLLKTSRNKSCGGAWRWAQNQKMLDKLKSKK